MAGQYLSDEFLDHVEKLWRWSIGFADRRENFSTDKQHEAQTALVAVVPRLLQGLSTLRENLQHEYRRSDALEEELAALKEKDAAVSEATE